MLAAFKQNGIPLLCGLACLAVLILIRAADPAALNILRERTFDLYQRVEVKPITPDVPVRIVDIDDASLTAFGQWPWPRTLLAQLVNALNDAGAAAIAFDMIFPEPDRSSPDSIPGTLGLSGEAATELSDLLQGLPDHDDVFASALARSPSVLGVAVATEESQPISPHAGLAIIGPDPTPHLVAARGGVASLTPLNESAAGLGGIHLSGLDEDAVIRQVPVLSVIGDAIVPGLSVEALRVAQGAQSLVLRTNPDPADPEVGIPEVLQIGAFNVPLTEKGEVRLLYGQFDPAATLSARDILSAATPSDVRALTQRVGGTLVLIGTSAPGLFDLRATPLGTIEPGVTMHAQALVGMLEGLTLLRPDWTRGLELVLAMAAGLIALCIGIVARPTPAALVVFAIVLGLGAASWWAFRQHLMLVDAGWPALTTLATYGAVVVPRLVLTDQQQRFIRNAFSHYLAESVLARLEADPEALQLKGTRRELTLMFMDIRGFTSRSERMEPTAAVHLLNQLLDPLSEVILKHDGTIDKFMGDGLMAFWNAPLDQPDHPILAVKAAIEMVETLNRHNNREGADDPLKIGIGLHTGEAFVGNMGSKRRFAYSAIGDTVNLAARIEAMTATLEAPLLISDELREAAIEAEPSLEALFQGAGSHTVKGREQPVTLWRYAPAG